MYCNNNIIKVKSHSVEDVGTCVVITVKDLNFATFSNLQKMNVVICQNIPETSGTKQVFISDGTNLVAIRVRTGNFLRADQISSRNCYPMIYGNDDIHFSLRSFVPESSYAVSSTYVASETKGAKTTK